MIVILEGILGIKERATYEFPDVGLVQLIGDNSNGKSILPDIFAYIGRLKILDKDARRTIINDQCEKGSIAISYKGKTLGIILHEEKSKCFVQLVRENGEAVARTFRDGGIKEILYEFGFRVYADNKICLQVHETFGVIPFVNSSESENGEMVEAVTTDTIAKQFMENYKEITHKKLRDCIASDESKLKEKYRSKSIIKLYDYNMYETYYGKLKSYYENIKHMVPIVLDKITIPPNVKMIESSVPVLEKIDIPPDVNICGVTAPKLSRVPIVQAVIELPILESFGEEVRNITSILDGKCPTCGRAYIEEEVGLSDS